ncbi:glycosyltransferase family 2 protein [Mucilaginibacter xinganensis]|uniref:Teichuronic acid biosynthesis glycosyltransferase TuaG n=1 Tax=Mucilaginibacter xinganensis TaxID=1234841 RepID=A0A223P3V7_9SPHI|nr:glycosyltransferase family A protein [Mucilaginibacter xinganensis]ASU36803.1 teichuronic acid biosynthesis glycosyltransferase TuaG [Mucilaginibacter xinganensis]
MNNGLISVIMPAFNAGKYIEETIGSVVAQTYKNWELIVVDDGSTDNTAEIVKLYTNEDSRIQYIFQENGRQGKARNTGIKNSKGPYIAFLDADDIWMPDKLTIQIKELSSANNIDLLFSQGYFINNDEVKDYNVLVKDWWDINDLECFLNYNQIPILSVLMKRAPLIAEHCFIEELSVQNMEDYHLWLKLLISNCKFRSIPDRLFYYRIHPEQSTVKNADMDMQIFYTYQDIYYRYPELVVQKAIVNKLKWYLFKDGFYAISLKMISQYFNRAGHFLVSFLIKNILKSSNSVSKKIVFHLIESYK